MLAGGISGLSIPRTLRSQDSRDDARRLVTREIRAAVERGLKTLSATQKQDGSFGSGNIYRRSVGVSSLAGLAYLAGGHTPGDGPYGETVNRTIDFLVSQCNPNGFIHQPDSRIHGPMYDHGFAVTFLAEIYGMTDRKDLRACLDRSIKLIISSQNQEGGWRYEPKPSDADVSVTVCQVMALRSAKNAGLYVPKETIDRAVAYLKGSQNSDGGFRYQKGRQPESEFARSAAALVGLNSAGIYEGQEIEDGIDYLKRFRPGPGSPRYFQIQHYLYGHYYAVQVMWHCAEDDDWPTWYQNVSQEVLALQGGNGLWNVNNTICPEYYTAMACLILQMPYNFLPIFQR
ncbi:MAG: terpene cyclase/mutase family protein [Planctomycetaceae bacterium]|nr:terpene cyclase/mutase family protein [Planctomycetaceae bacterium]